MIRSATTFVLSFALACIVLAVPASASVNPPLVGTYKTLAGTILPGRATESSATDGGLNQAGNMINAESFDGTTLGTAWKVSCAQAGPSALLFDGVVGGNGQRMFQTPYTGGTLWLSGTGAWGTGDPAYTGSFSSFVVIATQQIVNNQIVGIVTNVNFTGMLEGYENCFTMAISNAELVGITPAAPSVPGPFPGFVGPADCNATGTSGSYWDVHDITFTILGQCAVGTARPTWGSLKNMYR